MRELRLLLTSSLTVAAPAGFAQDSATPAVTLLLLPATALAISW